MKDFKVVLLSDKEMKVISAMKDCYMTHVKSAYLALVLEKSMCRSEVMRTLKFLMDKGLVEKIGRHVHTRYKLT